MTLPDNYNWYYEMLAADEYNIYPFHKTLIRHQSAYQLIEIIDASQFGKMLILDKRIQISTLDAFIYHEAIVHPGLLLLDSVDSVLILGGGPGATAREVLHYRHVKRVVMVEIDRDLVDICRTMLPEIHGDVWDDPRLEIVYGDAGDFLKTCDERFDAIVVDLTAPTEEGPARDLWTAEFHDDINRHLLPHGVMITHGGRATLNKIHWLASLVTTLRTVYTVVVPYLVHIPCQGIGNPWSYIVGSARMDPRQVDGTTIDRLIKNKLDHLRFWDGGTHVNAFTLPKPVREGLQSGGRRLTKAAPQSWMTIR